MKNQFQFSMNMKVTQRGKRRDNSQQMSLPIKLIFHYQAGNIQSGQCSSIFYSKISFLLVIYQKSAFFYFTKRNMQKRYSKELHEFLYKPFRFRKIVGVFTKNIFII